MWVIHINLRIAYLDLITTGRSRPHNKSVGNHLL